MSHPDGRLRVAIELHDVAPATWPACAKVLAALDALGAANLTLLVVPRLHGDGAMEAVPAFVRALDARLLRGDELVLHGYFHRDDQPPPRTPGEFVRRRLLTRSEGEFAALDEPTAASRLDRGAAAFAAAGWPLYGFVPPAWLLGKAARQAVARSRHPFEYVALRRGLYRLPSWRFERSANLVYSPDRAWRRAMSRVLIGRELRRARARPMLRLSIHPQDAAEPEVIRHWCALADAALQDRVATTSREWARASG